MQNTIFVQIFESTYDLNEVALGLKLCDSDSVLDEFLG